MLDGAARVGDLVRAAVEDGQPALGITDHGNMYGVLDFYRACREGGLNPVIGTEAYMAGESRHERPVRRGKVDDTGGDVEGGQKLYYHLTLLAETTDGYQNLIKLSSAAYLEGYYYKPRVDWELLERHHDGLIATTGCLGGVVLQALLAGNEVEAERWPAGCRTSSAATTSSSSSRTTASPTSSGPTPSWSAMAKRLGGAATGHQRQPLHPPRGRRGPRRPAVRADRGHSRRPEPLPVRGHRALPEVGRRDAPALRRGPRGLRQHPVHRRAGQGGDRAGPAEPARVPGARAVHRRHLRGAGHGLPPPPHLSRGPSSATATRCPTPCATASTTSSSVIGDMGFAAYFLVVWDLIRFARESGIRVGPGPGLGRRVLRRLLPSHRRSRPHPLRPALRTVLEPGPQADARHRHGLRRAVPRRR